MKQYDSEAVAGVIGIPFEEMEVLKHALDPETHWLALEAHGWALTDKGVMMALDALEIDQDKLPEGFWSYIEGCILKKIAPQKYECVAYSGPPMEYKVKFLRLSKNRTVLICEKDSERVRVLVRGDRNQNFVLGMQIPVTHIEKDLYRINRPSPKKKGALVLNTYTKKKEKA